MYNRIRLIVAAGTAALALVAAPAAGAGEQARYVPPGTVLEGSVETSTEAVVFPSGLDGRLLVRSCEGCAHSNIQLDAQTQFTLAGQVVSLRDMAQYALRNPGHALTIHYRLSDTVASRVTVLVR